MDVRNANQTQVAQSVRLTFTSTIVFAKDALLDVKFVCKPNLALHVLRIMYLKISHATFVDKVAIHAMKIYYVKFVNLISTTSNKVGVFYAMQAV